MATARKVRPPSGPAPVAPQQASPPDHWVLRAFDATYCFLASVKLAVICIFTLAMVLAGATFFESGYGIPAVRQFVYQNKAFAVLLAFLGTNIFCAATIRFPWKKRQTGFVVTHIGLLVILAGAFVSLSQSDEGQLGMPEGTKSNELVKINDSVVLVQKFDPTAQRWGDRYTFHLDAGAFSWRSEELAKLANDSSYQARVWLARAAFGSALAILLVYLYVWVIRRPPGLGVVGGSAIVSVLLAITAGTGILMLATPRTPRSEVLTNEHDPFKLVVTDYIASSGINELRAEDEADGHPTAKISLLVTPPGQKTSTDFLDGRNWFEGTEATFFRSTLPGAPATISYQYTSGPGAAFILDDFLHPPKVPNVDKAARFHYLDKTGARRVFEWRLNDIKPDENVRLPDSDLTITLSLLEDKSTETLQAKDNFDEATGEPVAHVAHFRAKAGDGPERDVRAIANLPEFSAAQGELPKGLLSLSYFYPPPLTAKGGGMGGALAKIEFLHVEGGKVYVRAIGREGLMGEVGQIETGAKFPIIASAKMPMQIAVRVDDVREKARLRNVYLPFELAKPDWDKAIPAIQAELTVKGVTKKVSLLHPVTLLPNAVRWSTLRFPEATYRVSFDFDRQPFPFTLELKKFEPGKDPGSDNPATFRSDVTLTDVEKRMVDEPRAIYMNNPLTHRDWSFYQSNFFRVDDPDTGRKNGAYASVFQVHYDPAWKIIYGGCLLLVFGIFLQFYMRAGLFSDGGKREREQAQARFEKVVAKARGEGATPTAASDKIRTKTTAETVEDL